MRSTLLSEWLTSIGMLEFSDENEEENEEETEEDENEENEEEEEDEEEEDDGEKPDLTKLQTALAAERKLRKQAEKDLKVKTRAEDRSKKTKTDELAATKDENDALKGVNLALAVKLRDQAVDQEIVKIASKLNFRDIDDALTLVKRADIEVDQDDDDPSEIEVDLDSVETAIKALATKKPHLLLAEGDREPSGSKFSGGKGKKKADASEEALKNKYPALNR